MNLATARAALAAAAPAITMRKNDCGEYRVTFTLAAYESDIESAYETALAMNRTGLVPDSVDEFCPIVRRNRRRGTGRAATAAVETITLQMGWNDCLQMLLVLHSDGDAKGRKYALGELRRMAALADKYVESSK